jgi:hypothetical protein
MVSNLVEIPKIEVDIPGIATEDTLSDVLTKLDDVATEATLGDILDKLAGALIPFEHDQIIPSYVGATTDISTVIYKKAGVTVATLTFTYDGSNRLINVVRT